jgi:hypothetical protein
MIRTNHLEKRFGRVCALRGASLTVAEATNRRVFLVQARLRSGEVASGSHESTAGVGGIVSRMGKPRYASRPTHLRG